MQCPICGSEAFGDFRGRVNVRCRGCGSFERSRLLWLILDKLTLTMPELPFFHVAPEIGIAKKMQERLGARYRAFDFSPAIYEAAGIPVSSLDLCTDLREMPTGSVGAMCHVHVLEHVRCNAFTVLKQVNRVLAPGGYHLFGVPFYSEHFREDLSPQLSEQDRLERFGHEDHVRSFGTRDFDLMFGDAFDEMERIPTHELVPAEAALGHSIPANAVAPIGSHSIFVFRKRAATPAQATDTTKAN